MTGPNVAAVPWEILHRVGKDEHVAWWQRAVLIGDFAPGRVAAPHYVVFADGRSAHPHEAPHCEACENVPNVSDLVVVDRQTGKRDFLEPHRLGFIAWPPATKDETCWWCNSDRALAMAAPPLCQPCAEHLRRTA